MQIGLEETTNTLYNYPQVIQTKKTVSAVLAAYVLCFLTIILLQWQFKLYGVNAEIVMGFREDNPAVTFLADHYI